MEDSEQLMQQLLVPRQWTTRDEVQVSSPIMLKFLDIPSKNMLSI